MGEKNLEVVLFHIVRLVIILAPWIFIGALVGQTSLESQFKAEVFLIAAGFLAFFVDLFLQTYLMQNIMWKLFYLALIIVFVYFGYNLIVSSYFLFLNGKPEWFWKVFSGIETYALLYFAYFSFKKIFVEIWELDIV